MSEYVVPYSNIREVKTVPQAGVVVSLLDPELWLASASGDRGIRERTAGVINSQYGGHLLFADRHLSVGAEKFVSLVQERTS